MREYCFHLGIGVGALNMIRSDMRRLYRVSGGL